MESFVSLNRLDTRDASLPVGAAMVVGGGIAGMQATLDLADQGFKVYLVEAQAAIGGKMAQLDKTFPTNDCAMCTISPRLVEIGRHPNVEILTNARVERLTGSAGNFRVTVRQEPRYVDAEACIACGDCVEVCPVLVPDPFNEGLASRRAIFKLYPQAVPNAFAISKRGVAACRDACPAGQRAQGYIALIREGRWQDALRVIKMDNPFPGICGRICNHRCEDACNRRLVDDAVNIRALKRFVTDKVYAEPPAPVEPAERLHEEKIAIIGAGPCGLTAAQDLVLAGYGVTIFEAMPVPGGMLRLGVPEYRLPTEIVRREVQAILDLGVDLRLNHRIDNLDDLFAQGFDAVLIAVGAHEGIRLPLPGADLAGVLVNTHFLRDVRLGRFEEDGNELGKRVLVLGGGNVAIDCARSALRLGREVHLACLESREEMPAHLWEVEAAEAEGVYLHPGRSFEAILGDESGNAKGVRCQQVASFSFDDSGGLQVEKVPGSEHTLPCDTVIFSVGQRAGLAFIPDDAGVGLTRQQTIAVNPNTLAATRKGVFAAGDSVSGTAFVIEAVDSGHRAAQSIIRYLSGEAMEPPAPPALPVVKLGQEEIAERLARGEIRRQARVPMPELPVSGRVNNFTEVERGYDDASAQAEAARCLACGVCSECMSCVFACGKAAIDHDMVATERTLRVGGIVLAPGYQVYRAELAEEFGFGRYPDVVTSLQFERLLSASGPTLGKLQRPSDGTVPRRIAFLQCIGSRDQSHDYCSAVCCMSATKEAIIAKEHHPDLDIHVFFMDMRAFSKGYWSYFERARARYGIEYTRCRPSALRQDPLSHKLILDYVGEEGELYRLHFDMVVLSVGMEIAPDVRALGRRLGIELDEYGFCHTVQFNPVESSRPGIYAVGPFREPKDIPESVVEASGAAAAVAGRLSVARGRETAPVLYPPERDVNDEQARVGVFVCHCGSNIGGYLDVPEVASYAGEMSDVVHAEANLYTCSQDNISHIAAQIAEHGLNRVVVASCTPLTHQPLFQDCLRNAGLNPFLFEMANIRNQCSWVHSDDWEAATAKAKDLVRMAVARAVQLAPLQTSPVPVTRRALVVGGGAAGMMAALSLAEQGFPVALVEREKALGGHLRHVYTALAEVKAGEEARALSAPSRIKEQPAGEALGSESADRGMPAQGMPPHHRPRQILHQLLDRVENNPAIDVHLETEVVATGGFKGNFSSTLRTAGRQQQTITHGATILATGGEEYRGPVYGYGSDPRILTQQELEAWLGGEEEETLAAVAEPASVVMIQCVGPAEQFCSRICCTVALKNALVLKQRYPQCQVTILYRDIRTYGFKERLYTEARRQGVLFIRYEERIRPAVEVGEDGALTVRTRELALGKDVVLAPDLLVLSMPVVPRADAAALAGRFKVPLGEDGFFQEAHVKLRPVDFPAEGIFMAGMAHYPRLLDETLIQAQAAAARAARVLSQDTLAAGGVVAMVDPAACTGCLTCVRICPFGAPRIDSTLTGAGGISGAARIAATVCQGCGTCAAECPAGAIELLHFTDSQMAAKVDALFRAEREAVAEAGG